MKPSLRLLRTTVVQRHSSEYSNEFGGGTVRQRRRILACRPRLHEMELPWNTTGADCEHSGKLRAMYLLR